MTLTSDITHRYEADNTHVA